MYHFTQVLDTSFEEAIAQVTAALKQEGLGILTEIDVQAAFKKKLDVDYRPYKILGACHPQVAYQMLNIDDKAGVLYPCNVVVQERTDGKIEVSAVDPQAMFQSITNPEAQPVINYARERMQAAMNHLKEAELVSQS
jgi:uncharacterized protein (DUF302 family)